MSKARDILEMIDSLSEEWEDLPKGWTKESLDKFAKELTGKTKGDPKGFFRECVAKMKGEGLESPEGFCASLKTKYLGK